MSFVTAALIGGGATILGGMLSSNAANSAAGAARDAANIANNTQIGQYNQNRADQAPWREAGGQAVGQMAAGLAPGGQFSQPFSMADYQADPGYAFRLAQGQKALDRVGAASGRSLSGAQVKASTDYNQNSASQEYGNAYNRFMNNRTTNFGELSNLAGLGQSSVGSTGQAGTNMANQIGANTMGAATVAGNAGMANAGAWANALNNGVNQWQNYNMMNNMFPQQTGAPASGYTSGINGSQGAAEYWGNPANTYTGYNGQIVNVGG